MKGMSRLSTDEVRTECEDMARILETELAIWKSIDPKFFFPKTSLIYLKSKFFGSTIALKITRNQHLRKQVSTHLLSKFNLKYTNIFTKYFI